jgi:hypothetical protein
MKIHSPKWANREHTLIGVTIVIEEGDPSPFCNLPLGAHPFNAAKHDPHKHCTDIFVDALIGEFGQIAEWEI